MSTNRSNKTIDGCGEQTTLEHDGRLVVTVGGIILSDLDVIVDIFGYNFEIGQRTGEICGDIDGLKGLKMRCERFIFGERASDNYKSLPRRPQQ